MIKLRPGRGGLKLSWSERDVERMVSILGADYAERQQAPVLWSIAKAAERRGLRLNPEVLEHLATAKEMRKAFKLIKALKDAPGLPGLFPHQRVDVAYFEATKFPAYLLAHSPGVGKTLPAILWAERCVGFSEGRILVVTPNSAKLQWRDEIRRWQGLEHPITIVEGTSAEQILKAQKDGWVIAHWESLVHARFGFVTKPWDVVIADEAHNIQNRKAQRSNTLFDLDAKFRIALTAHPYTNSPDELWSILHWLYPEKFNAFWRFWGMHVKATPKRFGGYEITGTRRPKLLQWEISPFVLRRTKKELGWIEPRRIKRMVQLSTRGRKEYEKLKKEFFVELEAHKNHTKVLAIPSVLARVTRLRQYLIDPALLGAKEKSIKFPVISELLRELDGPPVIFTQYAAALQNLAAHLIKQKKRIGYIYGSISTKERARAKKQFLAGTLDALLITSAGGEALNLGKWGNVVFLDLPWNPRGVEQVEGRVDRPEEGTGHRVPTTSYRIVVEDSYEERMEEKINKKHGMFSEVFTIANLKELFA